MTMKIAIPLLAVLGLLLAAPSAFARGILWDGEYQSVQDGSNMGRAPAQISMTGDPKRPDGYRCSFQRSGAPRVLLFALTQCSRTGSHVVCLSPAQSEGKAFTGDMCWGDIYLKTPHPAELGTK
jgi:hypothetical protein